MIRLNTLSQETGCDIMVKAEFANGGGSVKDRPALFLIQEGIKDGKNGYSSLLRRFKYSEGSLFWRFVIPKVRYSEGSLFRRLVNPKLK